MKIIEFESEINAPVNVVWDALWLDENYRKWTSAFSEGSYAVSNWKEGSGIHFLNSDGRGMYSKIAKLVENESMYFTHIGDIVDYKEVPVGENNYWNGFTENYDLEDINGKTLLKVNVQINEDHVEFFNEAFPKAMKLVKEIAEVL